MLRLPAYTVYLLLGVGSAICLQMIYPMLTLYYVQFVSLNPFQLVLVGTTMEITAFMFEVPTGVIADRYSRRASVILGEALMGMGFVVMAWTPTFTMIIAGAIIFAIGSTCISGALSAWIADELGPDHLTRVLLRYQQLRQVGGIVGILIGTVLGSYYVPLALRAGSVGLLLLSVFLIVTMPEHGFQAQASESQHQGLGTLLRTTLTTIRMPGVVRMLLLVSLCTGAFSESVDRLWEAHFLLNISLPFAQQIAPAVWFGMIRIGIQLWSLLGAEVLMHRLGDAPWTQVGKVLRLTTIGLAVSMLVFGFTTNVVIAIIAVLLVQGLRIIQGPLNEAWLNAHTPSSARATMFSVVSQADALGQIAGGPILGGVATLVSLPAALMLNGLLVMPNLLLYGRAMQAEVTSDE